MRIAHTLALAAMLGSTSGLAPAQDAADPTAMTCAELMAMDEPGRMAAMDAMATADAKGAGEGADAMASDDAMAEDDAMVADDAMVVDDAMASDDAMSDDAMAPDAVAGLMAACAGQPDMMAMDAMSAAMP